MNHNVAIKELQTDVRTMQNMLAESDAELYYRTNLETPCRVDRMVRDFDLNRVLQNERNATLIKIAALENRFAAELEKEPLVYNPDDFNIEVSTGEQAVVATMKDVLRDMIPLKWKVDPLPSDFTSLPKPSEYEQVRAAVAAEQRKRLAGEPPLVVGEDTNDLSWVTID